VWNAEKKQLPRFLYSVRIGKINSDCVTFIMHVLLEPDRAQIKTFVEAIFRHAGSDGFISIRSFLDQTPFHIGAVGLAEGLQAVVDVAVNVARSAAQHRGPTTFCPPLTVLNNRYHARAEDLLRGLILAAECDKYPLEARRQLEARLGPATMVVASGGEWTALMVRSNRSCICIGG
jgi:hypothetical protein